MKRLLQLVLILLSVQYAFCQKAKLDTVIHTSISRDTTMIFYSVIDGSEVYTFNHHRGIRYHEKYYYYSLFNGKEMDSTSVVMSTPVIYNGKVFFKNGGKREYDDYHVTKAVSIDGKGTIKQYDTDFYTQSFTTIAYRPSGYNLYLVNPETNDSTLFYELDYDKMNTLNPLEFSYNMVWFVTHSCCIANIVEVNPNNDWDIRCLYPDGKWAKPHDKMDRINCCNEKYIKHTDRYYDKMYSLDDMTMVSKVLSMGRYPYYVGMNISNGELQYHYIKSSLNDREEVIIPYVFNPQLDIQMYRAYTDEILTEKDIEGFGKYELGILRNLLFAKHNYAFKSEFYQAYFNIFEFYGGFNIGYPRESNVDNKLTAADKANIALIRAAEKKLVK